MKTHLGSAIIASLLSIGLAPSVQAATATEIARAVDGHYNRLKSFRSEFTEVYTGPGVSRSESGTVWLKRPARMKWEYHQPREKLFLTDSQNAYFYVPGERQARRTPLNKIDDLRSPLRYLLGKTKLEKELDGLSVAVDVAPMQAGNTVLRGVPKAMKDRVSDVWLEITPAFQIVRIVVHEVDGTTTDFRFTQLEENIPVEDSFFRLRLPPGVQLFEQDQVIQ